MKKARAWLDAHRIAYAFHDYKANGIDRASLERWAGAAGWETLLNRAGTTFRKLPDSDKDHLTEKQIMTWSLGDTGGREHLFLLANPSKQAQTICPV
jgi:arsenate reductase